MILSSSMIWVLHCCSTLMMTGLIWVIQLVHYPLMKYVDLQKWGEFHQLHTAWITPIVAPLMLIQLFTSFFVPGPYRWAFVVLSLGVFAVTAFMSVPAHGKLALAFDLGTLDYLVRANWLRTIMWTLHALLLAKQLFDSSPQFGAQ